MEELFAAGFGRGPELRAGLGHSFFKLGASRFPAVPFDGNCAAALTFAIVGALATLILAGVGAGASMRLGGGARSCAGALVLSGCAFALTFVQSAARMFVRRLCCLFVAREKFSGRCGR